MAHRNSWFTFDTWWFSSSLSVYLPEGNDLINHDKPFRRDFAGGLPSEFYQSHLPGLRRRQAVKLLRPLWDFHRPVGKLRIWRCWCSLSNQIGDVNRNSFTYSLIWMHYIYIYVYNHVIHECSGFSNNETWGLTSKHWDSSRNNNVSFLVRQAGASFMNKLVLPSKKLGDWFGTLWRVLGFNFSCSLWFRQKRSICCIFDYAHEKCHVSASMAGTLLYSEKAHFPIAKIWLFN